MNTLLNDLRYAARVLIKKPGFTSVAILTLALGIGANTAIFSVVNALLFRGLPFDKPEQLVTLWKTNPALRFSFEEFPVTCAVFDDWRRQAETFDSISILDSKRFALTGAGRAERVAGVTTSASFFRVMGVAPMLGRAYTEEEDQPGKADVVVISYETWQKRFGGDPDVCGKTMRLDGSPHTILGVMPRGFQFPRATDLPEFFQLPPQTDLWTPAALTAEQLSNRGSHTKAVIARLRSDASIAQAQTEVDAIASRNAQQYPDEQGWGAKVLPLKEQLVGKLRTALLVLLAGVGCVLLIACANVANLLLTRAAGRQREIAIRRALGASRARIVRQLVTESLLLSLAGGLVAVFLAVWGVDLLVAISPASVPRKHEIAIDGAALAFTFVVALATGLLFGLAPAVHASRSDLGESLKDSDRGSTSARSRGRDLLVVAEVALSLMLLVSAGLLIRSFARLIGTDPGFNPRGVAAMSLSTSSSRYNFDPKQAGFFKQVLASTKAIPGVVSVGAVSELPLSGSEEIDVYSFEGETPPKSPFEEPVAEFRFVDEGYFKTLQIPLVAGRVFDEHDNNDSQRVAIISESLARQCFDTADALGKRVKAGDFASDVPWATVVGVVKDLKHTGLDTQSYPQLYFPYQQIVWGRMVVVARASGDPTSLFGPMRDAVQSVDKDQPVTILRTMEDYLSDSVSQRRFSAFLLVAFAALALTLAAVGIYGVMSYSVSQRTREIGIRVALGANSRAVARLVVGQGMRLALIGVVIGLSASAALTRLMAGLLYKVGATDPVTFISIALLIAVVALLACWIPARRATRVDPMVALRCE